MQLTRAGDPSAVAFAILALLVTPSVAGAVERGVEDRATSHSVAIARGSPTAEAFQCSGVLISANVVLTARHCVTTVTSSEKACDAELGDVSEADARELWVNVAPWTADGAKWKRVDSMAAPTTRRLCGDDVALLKLADPVPESDAVPARPVLDEATFEQAIATRSLGLTAFGETGAGTRDAGIRRSRFDLTVGCVPGKPGFACDELATLSAAREFTTTAGACRGDSGGAAMLAADHGVVLGILSRSRGKRGDLLDADECAAGIFERTDVWAWRIARTVIDAASTRAPAPAWATALFPAAPRAGEFCVGEGSCVESARCVTLDEGRSLVCADVCTNDVTCGAGRRCQERVCVTSPAASASPLSSGCAVTAARHPGSRLPLLVALLALVISRRGRCGRGCVLACQHPRRQADWR